MCGPTLYRGGGGRLFILGTFGRQAVPDDARSYWLFIPRYKSGRRYDAILVPILQTVGFLEMRQCCLIQAVGRVRSQEQHEESNKIPLQSKHTTRTTAARQPLPTLNGVERNKSHALAQARPLFWAPGLRKSATCSARNQWWLMWKKNEDRQLTKDGDY